MSFAEADPAPLFATDWDATEIDGARGAAPALLRPGARWAWHGEALRLDTLRDPARQPLLLEGAVGRADLHRMAARRAARFRRKPLLPHFWQDSPAPAQADAALLREGFCVSDGTGVWTVSIAPGRLGGGFGAERLALFSGPPPPRAVALRIVEASGAGHGGRCGTHGGPDRSRRAELRPERSGFAVGTLVETPFGPCPVERLRPGDPVLTENGTAALRRVTVHPAVQALRLPGGLLGEDGPARPVTLGADTWIGMEGPVLSALFAAADGTSAPLREAFVRAGDLATVRGVGLRDRATLIALDLGGGPKEEAAMLMAGGLACLAAAPECSALRCLSLAEAQVMLADPSARFVPGMVVRGAA